MEINIRRVECASIIYLAELEKQRAQRSGSPDIHPISTLASGTCVPAEYNLHEYRGLF